NEGPPPPLGKDWEIALAYTVYDRGKWSRKRMSTGAVVDVQTFLTVPGPKGVAKHEGSRALSPSDYTLRAAVAGSDPPKLQVHLYCRAVDRMRTIGHVSLAPSEVDLVATFDLNGCNGALVPDRTKAHRRATVVDTARRTGNVFFRSVVHTAVGNV